MNPFLHSTMFAATLTLALPAFAQDSVVIDYRDAAFRDGKAFYAQTDKDMVAKAMQAAPDDIGSDFADAFAIIGDARGAFTKAGADERAFLVQQSEAIAIEPFPDEAAPLVVVMAGDTPAAFYRLPEDVQYQRLAGTLDADADGRNELLLETAFMNMGQSVTSLDIVKLGDDGMSTVDQIGEVYFDGCDNPTGERKRTAASLSLGSDGVIATPHDLGCD